MGTVAQGVLTLLGRNHQLILERTGLSIDVVRVASRRAKEVDLLGADFSTQLSDLVTDERVDIVLELIGGEQEAHQLIQDALAAGKRVVTANKAVIAAHGNTLLAGDQGSRLAFEAAVAGAIPIVDALQRSLVANRFRQLLGIINGTCNYMLTTMELEGISFDEVLARAQSLGYAEADPSFDIEGIDAAHKLTILLALAFGARFEFDKIFVEGIAHITADDIRYAAELGYRIKHLGIARQRQSGLEARVHCALVANDSLLSHVDGVANAVALSADAAGDMLLSGPGAGAEATASAAVADIIALAGSTDTRETSPQGAEAIQRDQDNSTSGETQLLAMEDIESAYYLRIPTLDRPGVFAKVAAILSDSNISIEAVIQKEVKAGKEEVFIVILTDTVAEKMMSATCNALGELEDVVGSIVSIRVAPTD